MDQVDKNWFNVNFRFFNKFWIVFVNTLIFKPIFNIEFVCQTWALLYRVWFQLIFLQFQESLMPRSSGIPIPMQFGPTVAILRGRISSLFRFRRTSVDSLVCPPQVTFHPRKIICWANTRAKGGWFVWVT